MNEKAEISNKKMLCDQKARRSCIIKRGQLLLKSYFSSTARLHYQIMEIKAEYNPWGKKKMMPTNTGSF